MDRVASPVLPVAVFQSSRDLHLLLLAAHSDPRNALRKQPWGCIAITADYSVQAWASTLACHDKHAFNYGWNTSKNATVVGKAEGDFPHTFFCGRLIGADHPCRFWTVDIEIIGTDYEPIKFRHFRIPRNALVFINWDLPSQPGTYRYALRERHTIKRLRAEQKRRHKKPKKRKRSKGAVPPNPHAWFRQVKTRAPGPSRNYRYRRGRS